MICLLRTAIEILLNNMKIKNIFHNQIKSLKAEQWSQLRSRHDGREEGCFSISVAGY